MNAARKAACFAMLAILSHLVIACGGDDSLQNRLAQPIGVQAGQAFADPQQSTYPVDVVFLDFYRFLGGEERLGPAISPASGNEIQKQQYVEAGLLLYDGQAPESDRFRLAPLGNAFTPGGQDQLFPKLVFEQVPGQAPVDPGFQDLYQALGGARFAGQTLGEARYNPGKARWEQYFENLGFYRLDGDDRVRLMAYGASACDFRCRYRPLTASIPNRMGALPEPFSSQARTLGEAFTGALLSGPRMAEDGLQEVVFENLVLVIDRSNPTGVRARPLPEIVGIPPQALASRQPDPLMTFHPLRGELGHNVPAFFEAYLAQHGGLEVSGLPTSEVFQAGPGSFRQCFTNLCLDFNLNNPESRQLGPAPLGETYLDRAADLQVSFLQSQSLEKVELQIWEGKTFVTPEETQQVHVAVFEDGQPLKNREPVLTLTLPDGTLESYHFPPTSEEGLSGLTLPEIPASSGTLVAYQVCLNGPAGDQVCMGDNFMIWNHP